MTKAVLILVEKEYKNHAWDRAKKMMNNVDQFKNRRAAPPLVRRVDYRGKAINTPKSGP